VWVERDGQPVIEMSGIETTPPSNMNKVLAMQEVKNMQINPQWGE
jgi:hypothetical protein